MTNLTAAEGIKPLSSEEANTLREKHWSKIIDDLNRDPGESLLEWELRVRKIQELMRSIRDGAPLAWCESH